MPWLQQLTPVDAAGEELQCLNLDQTLAAIVHADMKMRQQVVMRIHFDDAIVEPA